MFAGESRRVSRIIPRRDASHTRRPLHIRIPCVHFSPFFRLRYFARGPRSPSAHFGVNICSMLARGFRHANLILRMRTRNDFSRVAESLRSLLHREKIPRSFLSALPSFFPLEFFESSRKIVDPILRTIFLSFFFPSLFSYPIFISVDNRTTYR